MLPKYGNYCFVPYEAEGEISITTRCIANYVFLNYPLHFRIRLIDSENIYFSKSHYQFFELQDSGYLYSEIANLSI